MVFMDFMGVPPPNSSSMRGHLTDEMLVCAPERTANIYRNTYLHSLNVLHCTVPWMVFAALSTGIHTLPFTIQHIIHMSLNTCNRREKFDLAINSGDDDNELSDRLASIHIFEGAHHVHKS